MAARRITSQGLAAKNAELSCRTETNRKKMIQSELSVIEVFCDRAEIELRIGHPDRARDALGEAKKAVGEARKRLKQSSSSTSHKEELQEHLEELQSRLKSLERAA